MGTFRKQNGYLPRSGVYLAIIGVVCLLVFVLIFQEDWMQRYKAMIAMIPISIIALLLIRKLPLVSGLMLAALGVAALVLDILFSPHTQGEITGRGIGLTAVLVCMPLLVSGVLFIFWGKKHR